MRLHHWQVCPYEVACRKACKITVRLSRLPVPLWCARTGLDSAAINVFRACGLSHGADTYLPRRWLHGWRWSTHCVVTGVA